MEEYDDTSAKLECQAKHSGLHTSSSPPSRQSPTSLQCYPDFDDAAARLSTNTYKDTSTKGVLKRMSFLPHLGSKTTGTRISREIWFGWLQGGSRCRAPRVGMGMGPLQRFSVAAASPLYDDGKQPATTSPDPPGRRVSDNVHTPLLATTEKRLLPDHYSLRTSSKHSPETLHDPSIEHATHVLRPSSRMGIDTRPAPETEPCPQPKHPPETAHDSSLQQSEHDMQPSSSGNAQNRLPPQSKNVSNNSREEAWRTKKCTKTSSSGVLGGSKRQGLTSATILRVVTLNPEKMASTGQQILNISTQTDLLLDIQGQRAWLSYSQPFISKTKRNKPFPKGTRGVLYYHSPPPNRPEVSGALRFRVCNSLADFDQGTDLETPSGSAWGPSLYGLVSADSRNFVVNALVRDNCVDANLVKDLRFVSRSTSSRHHLVDKHTLYDISDPFDIELGGPLYELLLITRHHVGYVDLRSAFRDHTGIRPYRGLIRVRFELLPFHRSPSVPTLVLRVLERLTPITCTVPDYNGPIGIPLKGGLMEKRQQHKIIKHRWKGSYYEPYTIVLRPGASNADAILETFASEQPISAKSFER